MNAVDSWKEEKRSAWLYRKVSDAESGTPRQVLFLELASAADEQAGLWAAEADKSGLVVPEAYVPDLRTRLVGRLIPIFGVAPMRRVLAAMKVRGMTLYNAPLPDPCSHADGHAREAHHGKDGGALRAAVFGVNDGLVSNASLILGVAGAGPTPSVILLSGIAGLLAGAFSMAAGEYISVRAQREYYEYQIALEREELAEYPEEEVAELTLIYTAKGLPRPEAERLAGRLLENPDEALDTLAREELGLNPSELGSPWVAAIASFFAFSAGAFVPLLPYLLLSGSMALNGTLAVTALALFGVGSTISLFTGRHALRGGLRMLLIGAMAGAATWSIGRALGVVLG
jgi:VIT1/CCC1 family predicted Fe2+/Mn2+ transporter